MCVGGRLMELYTEMSLVDPYAAWILMCSWGDREQHRVRTHRHPTLLSRLGFGFSNSICGNLRSLELMQVLSWIMNHPGKC